MCRRDVWGASPFQGEGHGLDRGKAMSWDEGLRVEQAGVAGAPRGDYVVLAGPGTGKTYVLVRRVQHLVEVNGIPAHRITALTFTRAAAAEMRQRLEERLGELGKKVRVSTIHSYALREILRNGAQQLPSPLRVVGDWEERNVVVEELARILNRNVRDVSNGKDGALERLADDWDTLSADGEGWEAGHPDPQFLSAWRRHREIYGYTLRSELVYQLLVELRSNPEFSPTRGTDVLLVDEYQDLNRCDLDAIEALKTRAGAEIFASGDDDQSIYSFRHAHPAGIRGFGETYPAAMTSTMTECMRCGPEVVNLALWLIEHELGRVPKTLTSVTSWSSSVHLVRFDDQVEEARGVARMIERAVATGTAPHEILVLMKNDTRGRVSAAIESALKDVKIDAYLPRRQRTTSDAVQILLEYLVLAQQLASNDGVDHLAIRALLQLEDNDIGAARIRKFVTFCFENSVRFGEAVEIARKGSTAFPGARYAEVVREVDRIVDVARRLEPEDDEDFDQWLARVASELAIPEEEFQLILQATHQVVAEIEDQQASDATAVQDAPSTTAEPEQRVPDRRDFVQDLLVAMTGLGDTLPATEPEHVTVTTMHGAKGLSADLVIVLQVEEEVIPGEALGVDADEARRLLYVSVTRAKKKLILTACHRRTGPQRFVGQREVEPRSLSTFVRDYGLQAQTTDEYLAAN